MSPRLMKGDKMPTLIMTSEVYGEEEFNYDSMIELLDGQQRLREKIMLLNDGIERCFEIRDEGYDLADDDLFKCANCGVISDVENSIDCLECKVLFCDNCYDTGQGDGCHCHTVVTKQTRGEIHYDNALHGRIDEYGAVYHCGMGLQPPPRSHQQAENARHLAACWNAAETAGLSTAALEKGVVKGFQDALESIIAWWEDDSVPDDKRKLSLIANAARAALQRR